MDSNDNVKNTLDELLQQIQNASLTNRMEAMEVFQRFMMVSSNEAIVKQSSGQILNTLELLLGDKDSNVQEKSCHVIATLAIAIKQDSTIFTWLFKRLNSYVRANDKASPTATVQVLTRNTASSANTSQRMAELYLLIIRAYLEQINTHPAQLQIACQHQISLILEQCRNILENIEETHLIAFILDIIENIAVNHQSTMQPLFHDIIDLLVGWFLDRDTSFKLRQRISVAFSVLRELWASNIDWTCSLLEKFLIDMKSLSEERQYNTFVSCFSAIVTGLGNYFSLIAAKFVGRLFAVFVTSLDKFTDKHKRIWKGTTECIIVIANELGKDFSAHTLACMEFFGKMLKQSTKFELPFDWFDIVIQVLSVISSELKIDHLKPLFSAILSFVQVIQNTSPDIHIAFGKIYRTLLLSEDLNEKLIQDIILYCFNEVPTLPLTDETEFDARWTSATEMTVAFQTSMLIYVLAIQDESQQRRLAYILQFILQKNQEWLSMEVFSPQIFSLFVPKLRAMYAKLRLVTDDTTVAGALDAILNYTKETNIKLQALGWTEDVITNDSSTSSPYKSVVPKWLPILCNDRETKVRVKAIELCASMINVNTLSISRDSSLYHLVTLVFMAVGDLSSEVWKAAIDKISQFAPLIMDEITWSEFKLWRRQYEANGARVKRLIPYHGLSSNQIVFRSSDFTLLFDHFRGEAVGSLEQNLEQLFYLTSCHWDNKSEASESGKLIDRYSSLQTFFEQWAVHEAVRYCLVHRLKTPFGNAVQTFEKFETLLKEHVGVSSNNKHLPLFLSFLGELEKQMTLLIDGYKNLQEYPQNTFTFFTTNAKVCQDWFSRLRPLIVMASSALRSHSSLVRNAVTRLYEIRSLFVRSSTQSASVGKAYIELETTIIQLCVTLCESGDSDMILGLLSWLTTVHEHALIKVRDTSDEVVSVNKYAVLQSSLEALFAQSRGMYEEALRLYQERVYPSLSSLEKESAVTLVEQILLCFSSIRDWEQFNSFFNEVNNVGHIDIDSINTVYMQALSQYDIEQKSAIDQQALSSLIHKDSVHPLTKSKSYMLSVLLDDRVADDNVYYNLLRNSLLASANTTATGMRPYLIQLHLYHLLKHDEISLPFVNGANASIMGDNKNKLDFFNEVDRLFSSRSDSGSSNLRQLVLLNECKVARRSTNLQLAQRLLASIKSEEANKLERTKILYAIPDKKAEALHQLASVATDLQQNTTLQPDVKNRLLSNVLLKLNEWLDQLPDERNKISSHLGVNGEVTEYLLERAIEATPNDRSALLRYAQWCSSNSDLAFTEYGSAERENIKLTFGELVSLKEILLRNDLQYTDEFVERFTSIFSQFKSDLQKSRAELESLGNNNETIVNELLSLYGTIKKRVLFYQQKALESYLKCLQFTYEEDEEEEEEKEQFRETNIMIVLHLLKFFTTHPADLSALISEGIEATPAQVWFDIIPQILSHIGSSDVNVQQIIKSLLLKIGKDRPQVLAYPLIVGRKSNQAVTTAGRLYREIIHEMNNLSVQHFKILEGVQLFVHELGRITVLREEKWLNAIPIFQRKLEKACEAFKKAKDAISEEQLAPDIVQQKLHAERVKYAQSLSSVLVSMQTLLDMTSATPETKYEHAFQEKYEMILNRIVTSFLDGLTRLIDDSADHTDDDRIVQAVIRSMSQLTKSFNQIYYSKRGVLKLASISPVLSNISEGRYTIPIPGTEFEFIDPQLPFTATVASFKDSIQIVASKTKPKRLTLIGTDGQEYTYLLKGREDLHLDERIMQFLRIVNLSLLNSQSTSNLRARNYAVVPLGDRSGLIRWVDGSAPIFSLHRKWHLQKQQQQQQQQQDEKFTIQPFRPVDLFYDKLVPLLKQHGIKNAIHPYPMDIVKQVIKELSAEMPRDLLAKEIWLKSNDLDEWWDKTRMFNRSLGVMSIIGYIIGLGDRHLDNILYDYNNGEVVHIDYNVCFDKGKQLKVPEVVPFRMTPVLQAALGLTGVDGMFRSACEKTLSVMRRSKHTLLMLLEAFVYDPLVDWASDNISADDIPASVEQKVTLGLFKSRIAEMRANMKQVFQAIVEQINRNKEGYQKLMSFVADNSEFLVEYKKKNDKVKEMTRELNLLKQHSPVIQSNIENQQDTLLEKSQLQSNLEDQLKNFAMISDQHNKIFESLTTTDLSILVERIMIPAILQIPGPQLTQVIPYIHQNLRSVSLSDFQTLEGQCVTAISTHNTALSVLIDTLKVYQSYLLQFTSMQYIEQDKSYIWSKSIQQVLIDPSLENIESTCDQLSMDNENHIIRSSVRFVNKLVGESEELTHKIQKLEEHTAGSQFLEKSKVESLKNLLQTIKGSVRDGDALASVYKYILAYTLHLVHERNVQPDNAASTFFGAIQDDDELGGALEEDAIDDTPETENLHFAHINIYDWSCYMKLTRTVSYLDVLGGLHSELNPQQVDVTPSSSQLMLLATSLKRTLNLVFGLLQNFSSIIFPETVKALQSRDLTVIQSLNTMISTGKAFGQGTASQIIRNQYIQLSSIGKTDSTNAGNVLLAAYDGLFTNLENNIREFSTNITTADETLFVNKLGTITELLSNFMDALFKSKISSNSDLHYLHHSSVQLLKKYVDSIISDITMNTFQSLLSTWEIDPTRKQTDLEMVVSECSLFANVKIDMFNMLLNNLFVAQQVLDENAAMSSLRSIEQTYFQSVRDSIKNHLLAIVWNNVYGTQIVEQYLNDYSADDATYNLLMNRALLLQQVNERSEEYRRALEGFNQKYQSFETLEKRIVQEMHESLKTQNPVMSSHHFTLLMQNIGARNSSVNMIMSGTQGIVELINGMLEMEKYRNKNDISDQMQSTILQLIDEWRSIHEHELHISQDSQKRMKQIEHMKHQEQTLKHYSAELKRMESTHQNVQGIFSLLVNTWLESTKHLQEAEGTKYMNILTELANLIESVLKVTKMNKNWNDKVQEFQARIINLEREFAAFLGNLSMQRKSLIQDTNVVSLRDITINLLQLTIDQYETCHTNCQEGNKDILIQLSQICQQIDYQQKQAASGLLALQGVTNVADEPLILQNDEEIEEQPTLEDITMPNTTTPAVGNSYAIKILKRVKKRLDNPRSVSDQVQTVIDEAMNLDNLAMMYEGWAAYI